MKRHAFTMLEVVFVIVIIGILAILATPQLNSNRLQLGVEQLASHLRYTQHLAMTDNKFNPSDPFWYRGNWQMEFKKFNTPLEYYYEIYSDTDHLGNSDTNETARDPLTNETLDYEGNVTNLTKSYGIVNIVFDNSCHRGTGVGEISFDAMGRPDYSVTDETTLDEYLLTVPCKITLTDEDGKKAEITVAPVTGFVSIKYL